MNKINLASCYYGASTKYNKILKIIYNIIPSEYNGILKVNSNPNNNFAIDINIKSNNNYFIFLTRIYSKNELQLK